MSNSISRWIHRLQLNIKLIIRKSLFTGTPKRTRVLIGLTVAILIGLVLCIAFCGNLLYGAQLQSTDFLFRSANLNNSAKLDQSIVIVGIDDKSLQQLGHFSSWSRTYYAQIVDVLAREKARVVAFDVLFSEPAPGDEQLVSAIANAGNVVLPSVLTSGVGNSAITDRRGMFLRPLADLQDNAIAIGHANFFPDMDGIVRRLPVVIQSGEDYEPSLALAVVAKYLRRPGVIESGISGKSLPFVGRMIPISGNNEMTINYISIPGDSEGITYQAISFVDVLREEFDSAFFENKIVILGATASGLGDTFWTPTGKMMNGVEIHAHAINTILTNDFIKPTSSMVTVAMIMILAILCGLMSLYFRLLWAIVSALSLYVVYFLLVSICFDAGIMLNILYPSLTILCTFMGITVFNVASERSRRKEITKTFGRYVSPSVADSIMAALEQGKLTLGGKEQEVTVMFADVRGFSDIAGSMQPKELVNVLNKHLSVIVQVVLKYHGVVNKFGGDSVMAIWNAPTACEGHPLLAIRAAIEAQIAIRDLHDREPLLPRMDFGIGINTGRAVAGNMGSQDRVEYSVIGDAVNLASRITDVTQGGKVWIGINTYKLVKDYTKTNSLGEIAVKWKSETARVYEVLDISPEPISGNHATESGGLIRLKLDVAGKEV